MHTKEAEIAFAVIQRCNSKRANEFLLVEKAETYGEMARAFYLRCVTVYFSMNRIWCRSEDIQKQVYLLQSGVNLCSTNSADTKLQKVTIRK